MDSLITTIIALPIYFVILYISVRLATYAYFRSRTQVTVQFRKESKWRVDSNT
jgi:hypothetical protein